MGNTHYKRWVIPYLIFLLIAMALAPFLPAFAIGEQWLPRWLWWFQTPDNDLDGDESWKTKHVQWLRNGSYLKRVLWLLRNPAYGLAWGPLAFVWDGNGEIMVSGDTTIKARDNAKEGWYELRLSSNYDVYERTRIIQWKLRLKLWKWETRYWRLPICWKIRTGWILGDLQKGRPALYLVSFRPMPFRPAK